MVIVTLPVTKLDIYVCVTIHLLHITVSTYTPLYKHKFRADEKSNGVKHFSVLKIKKNKQWLYFSFNIPSPVFLS